MMIRDLARGSEGVTEGNDLKVTPLTVPAGGVLVGDGSGVVRGRAVPWQGHYTAYNIGSEQVPIAPTGGTPRTDLVVMRVLDPEYEGNRNPAKDKIVFFDVIPAVSATATVPPPGFSAIPLARINLPANTGTITAAMITDLRRIANPRRERRLSVVRGFPTSRLQNATTWSDWPLQAKATLDVPPWAVRANIISTLSGIRFEGAPFCLWRHKIGSGLYGGEVLMDDDSAEASTPGSRGATQSLVLLADTLDLGSELRGTTQDLRIQVSCLELNTFRLDVNQGTNLVVDVEFVEGSL
ncbi:hypothetical protein [Streptomyces lavendulae]|uniref:hypothetical protein n=1 Tax=Streptomyces lavendulae TaxID=1914 RepID=UPI0036E84DD4